MPGTKHPILSAKSLFFSKGETKEPASTWEKSHIPGYCLGTQVPKKTPVLWLNTPMGKSKLQRLSFHPWKNRFLSSYWTIIIWQFKIVIYFLSGIYHVSCALNPQLKFLDATYVQDTSEGNHITGCSLFHSLLRICFIHSESKKPEALQSIPLHLHLWKGPPLSSKGSLQVGEQVRIIQEYKSDAEREGGGENKSQWETIPAKFFYESISKAEI